MNRIHTIVIGAGQAGLALSRCLTDRRIEHVVLERGRVAQRWSERWDSLRLLSPNWMTRLPGWQYRGSDPGGFMKRDEVIAFLRQYARSFDAPVEEKTDVTSVAQLREEWKVVTDRETWLAQNVVIATGHCQTPRIPTCARNLSGSIEQISTVEYRKPSQLADGGVLVVGASASGLQLARELRRAGRHVVLSAGRHSRLPRRYRGRDIHYWLDRIGILDRALTDMRDPLSARHEASLQLAAGTETLDLQTLAREGVRITGRLTRLGTARAEFANDLGSTIADADRRMRHLLQRIDGHIAGHGAQEHFPEEEAPAPIEIGETPRTLHLAREHINTVLWATGYRRDYRWLHAPVLDAGGEIRHTRGRTPAPGLYVLGLQFMIRRNSSLIDGVGRDAEEIAEHIVSTQHMRREAA